MTLVTTPGFTPAIYSAAAAICHTELVDNLTDINTWIGEMSNQRCRNVTGSTTLLDIDRYVVYTGGANATITLPPISSVEPEQNIRIYNRTNNEVRVVANSGETIVNPYTGASQSSQTYLYFQGDTLDLFGKGTTWLATMVQENNSQAYAWMYNTLGDAVNTSNYTVRLEAVFNDFSGSWNGITGYIVPVDGIYSISSHLRYTGVPDGMTLLHRITRNGGTFGRSNRINAADYQDTVAETFAGADYFLQQGDLIELVVDKSAGNINIDPGGADSYLQVNLTSRRIT